MQFKRYAMLALAAMTLSACGSDDDPTGAGGMTDQQRLAEFQKFNDAFGNAIDAEAYEAADGFLNVGIARLFGTGTASVTVGAAGASLRAATPAIASAVAGQYEAFGISWRTEEDYGGGETFADELYAIIAFRDTTNIIGAYSFDALPGSFTTTDTYGFIYESGKEWIATAGSAQLSNMQTGGNCNLSAAMQQAIDQALEDDQSLTGWSCQNATFNGALNITESQPNNSAATGSPTASFSRSGLPGIRIIVSYDYSTIAR